MENEESEKQIFNMSLAILERISKIQDALAIAGLKNDFPTYAATLRILKRQVFYRFNSEEKENDKLFTELIDLLLPEFLQKMRFNGKENEYYLPTGEIYENYGLFSSVLESYEEFLMGAMDDRDMLQARKEDKRRAISDM